MTILNIFLKQVVIFNNRKAWLCFFIAANVILRFYKLSDDSLYGDEAFSIATALMPLDELINVFKFDQNPPLYTIVLHFWMKLFSVSALSAKALSVVFTIISSILLFHLGYRIGNLKTAIYTSVLFLLNNAILYYSHEVRAFAMEGTLCIISFMLFLNILQHPKLYLFVSLAAVNLILLFTHYISFFIPVTQFLILLLYVTKNSRTFLLFSAAHFIAALAFLPWFYFVINNIPQKSTYWLKTPDIGTVQYFLNLLFNNSYLEFFHYFIIALTILFIIKPGIGILNSAFKPRIALVLLMWNLVPFLGDYFIAQITPVFHLRYILYVFPGMALLTGYILSMISISRILNPVLPVIVLTLSLINININPNQENDWSTAVKKVNRLYRQYDTAVLVSSYYKTKEFSYYFDKDIFMDYKHLNENLKALNIFQNLPVAKLEGIDTSKFIHVILVKSHHQFTDPENNTEKQLIQSGYEVIHKIADYEKAPDPVQIIIYTKKGAKFNLFSNPDTSTLSYNYLNKWKTDTVKNIMTNESSTYYFTNYDFEKVNDPFNNIDTINFSSPPHSTYAFNGHKYSETFDATYDQFRNSNKIFMEFKLYPTGEPILAKLITTIEKNSNFLLYNEVLLNSLSSERNVWQTVRCEVDLMNKTQKDSQLKIYFYNEDSTKVYIDDMQIILSR